MPAVDEATMRAVADIVRGAVLRGQLVTLRSGQETDEYVDLKRALSEPVPFMTVTRALATATTSWYGRPGAVGGKGVGGHALAVGVAVEGRWPWFVVRDGARVHGTRREVDGCSVAGRKVVLVEDVTTTGGDLVAAVAAVNAAGGNVIGAASVVDRGYFTREHLASVGCPFMALVSARDVGLKPLEG